jgi:hypothetical protein
MYDPDLLNAPAPIALESALGVMLLSLERRGASPSRQGADAAAQAERILEFITRRQLRAPAAEQGLRAIVRLLRSGHPSDPAAAWDARLEEAHGVLERSITADRAALPREYRDAGRAAQADEGAEDWEPLHASDAEIVCIILGSVLQLAEQPRKPPRIQMQMTREGARQGLEQLRRRAIADPPAERLLRALAEEVREDLPEGELVSWLAEATATLRARVAACREQLGR